MKIVFLLLILLIAVDFVLNDALILNKLNEFQYPIPILIKLLLFIILLISVVLLLYSIIMEWNLWPKIKHKKTLFELEKDLHKNKHKTQ